MTFANDIRRGSQGECPNGGIKVDAYTCCKNGFASHLEEIPNKGRIFGEYTEINGKCGCPDGGIPSKKYPSSCCKDGFIYVDYKHDYVDVDFDVCGYPKEGYKPKGDVESWCKDGYRLSLGEKSFSWLSPEECGCPAGSEYHEGEYGGYCCQDGYELQSKGELKINFKICGCPKGTKHAEYDVCCLENKKGYAIENLSVGGPASEKLDHTFCGCPENGKKVNIFLSASFVCCKDGYELDTKTGLYSKKTLRCE